MSRRWGISIPSSSFANDNTGSVFVMWRPLDQRKRPSAPRTDCGAGAAMGARPSEQEWCEFAHVVRTKETQGAPADPSGPGRRSRRLLQFDDGALRFELLLDFLGFLLGHAFLHHARGALDQVLRFLQAEAGDRADLLDHLNLLLAPRLEDDGELRLFLGRGGGGGSGGGRGRGD